MSIKKYILIIVILVVIAAGYLIYQNFSIPFPARNIQPSEQQTIPQAEQSEKIYSVEELIKSGFSEGKYVKVKGFGGQCIDVRVSEDYEGSGAGCFLVSSDGNYGIHVGEFNTLVYKDKEIIVEGYVRYCGGRKKPKYICGLRNVKLLEVIQSQQEEKVIKNLQLKISAPFSTTTLSVNSQGIINYEVKAPKAGIERQVDSKEITKQQFSDLSDLIIQNNFWSFNEQYFDENLMDATTYTVEVQSITFYRNKLADVKVHSVSCYGDCPKKIVEIINKIKELWGKEIIEIGV
jgi:hypothetical protein